MVTFVRLVLARDSRTMRRSKVYRIMLGCMDDVWLRIGSDRCSIKSSGRYHRDYSMLSSYAECRAKHPTNAA
jgi:hypothetical protein